MSRQEAQSIAADAEPAVRLPQPATGTHASRPPRSLIPLLVTLCVGGIGSFTGCQSIIHAVDSHNQYWNTATTVHAGKPEQLSNETWTVLRYWDLNQSYLTDPEETLEEGMRLFRDHPNHEWAVALAELSYRAGEARTQADRHRSPVLRIKSKRAPDYRLSAEEYYLNSVSYAYYFLFAEGKPINEFDRRVATACKFYNAGLQKCLTLAHRQGGFAPQKSFTLKTASGDIISPVDHKGFVWRTDEFNELQFVDNLHRADDPRPRQSLGLGVPLIALRHRHEDGDARERFLVKRHPFAVTAFFRPDLTRLTPYAPQETPVQTARTERRLLEQEPGRQGGLLELYDLAHHPDPVERDVGSAGSGSFRSDGICPARHATEKSRMGRVLQSGLPPGAKRPVHDRTLSEGKDPRDLRAWTPLPDPSPGTPCTNPSGRIPKSGTTTRSGSFSIPRGRRSWPRPGNSARRSGNRATLRRGLRLSQMVMIGHSMGGLLSKLQVTESDDKLWNLVSKQPLEQLKTNDETRGQLQQTFFFEPQPAITRVIYIATPHRARN
ncbi:MAG: hypothetical protein U0903_13300 [Planctomycetales bacterium]